MFMTNKEDLLGIKLSLREYLILSDFCRWVLNSLHNPEKTVKNSFRIDERLCYNWTTFSTENQLALGDWNILSDVLKQDYGSWLFPFDDHTVTVSFYDPETKNGSKRMAFLKRYSKL